MKSRTDAGRGDVAEVGWGRGCLGWKFYLLFTITRRVAWGEVKISFLKMSVDRKCELDGTKWKKSTCLGEVWSTFWKCDQSERKLLGLLQQSLKALLPEEAEAANKQDLAECKIQHWSHWNWKQINFPWLRNPIEIIETEIKNLTGKQEAGKENWIHNKHPSFPVGL